MRKKFGWVMMVLSISFTLCGCGSGGGGGSTGENTSNATLTALSITPTNPSIAKGTSQQFTATGTYSDNTTKDLTTFVNWSSSAPAVATTSDAGLATTAATGGTTIYATSGNISGSTILTVYEATGPVAPTGIRAIAGNNQVYVSWNSVSGATTYNIYWSTTSGVSKSAGTKISSVTSPYSHTGLSNGTTYYYVVTAVNSLGESAESTETSATPIAQWSISNNDNENFFNEAYSVKNTADKGYILANRNNVTKYSEAGIEEWNRTYFDIGRYFYSYAEPTSDNGYIVVADYYPYAGGTGPTWVYVIKLDNNGNKLWEKQTSTQGYPNSIHETSDQGFIIGGYYGVVKLDKNGNEEWTVSLGGSMLVGGDPIIQTSDGDYIVTAFQEPIETPKIMIVKLSPSGAVKWKKTYASTEIFYPKSIIEDSDGGYLVVGGSLDILAMKVGTDGSLIWSKKYSGAASEVGSALTNLSNGRYIVAGSTTSFGSGGFDAFVIVIDTNGNIEWQKCYGGSGDDTAASIIQSQDGGYALAGRRGAYSWLLKTDKDGNVYGVDYPVVTEPNFSIADVIMTTTDIY